MKLAVKKAVEGVVKDIKDKDGRLKFDASLVICAFLLEWGKQHGKAAQIEATEEVKFALRDLGIEPSRLIQ